MINYTELKGLMPLHKIVEALDDNGDGAADAGAWTEVLAAVEERIGDCFGGSVPDELADSVGYARKIFAMEILFDRRNISGDKNPYTKRAEDQEKRLRALAGGAENASGTEGGSFVGTDAKISTTTGLIL